MNIPKFFIKNRQFTICIFLLLTYWGIQTFMVMPKSEDPLFSIPQYKIVCIYPGASPGDLEELVVQPIESALGGLTDIEFIKGDIRDGIAVVQIKFTQDVDEDKKFDEVQQQVNKVIPRLPSGIRSINVDQISINDVNILQYALISEDKPYREIEDMAYKMKKSIEKVGGIKEVSIDALPKQQITVNVDLLKMAAYNISLQNISDAVKSESANIPGGYLNLSSNRYNIVTSGEYNSAETVQNTIIKSSEGKLVYLKDVADVYSGYELINYYARYNGKKAIFISVNQQDGTNIFNLTEQIEKQLEPYYNSDNGIHLEKVFDQSLSVSHRLSGLYRDFIIAILLVLITLLPLGTRASVVVMFSVPTSIFIGLILLNLAGVSLNQFSIVGLIIALGLLVDDSIIVVENIVAKLRKGENRTDAAINGTNQLLFAIISVTICIILSFLPLITLDGMVGDFIRPIPLAVVFTMIGSFFVSITLTPMVSKWIMKDKIGDNIFYRALMRFNEGIFMKALEKCLAHPKTTLFSALALIVLSLGMVKAIGTSLFPSAEKPLFFINVTLPLEKNVASVDSVCRWVENELHNYPQITKVATNIGKGNPQVYYNLTQLPQYSNTGQLFCQLENYEKAKTPILLDSLREVFSAYPGAKIEVKEFTQGPPVKNPIEVRIIGDDQDTLRVLAAQIADIMNKTPGTLYVDNPLNETKSRLKININHARALKLGVPVSEISKTVRMAFAGQTVGEFSDNSGKDYNFNIVLTTSDENKTDFEAFSQIYVPSMKGVLIPLSQLASYQFEGESSIIQHYDKQRSVIVSSDVASGYLASELTGEIVSKIKEIKLPPSYNFQIGGESEKQKESFGGLISALIIAVFAIVAVLILAFKGIKGTIIVLSAVPLGIFGSVIALWLGGYTLSFTALIGIVTLVGLEVKNTIIIVDFTNQMRILGYGIDRAIEMANEERFTPIFLTTITAVCALMPLVIERSDFFSPLALVIIGGLLSSLFLTRFVEPVLYKLLMK